MANATNRGRYLPRFPVALQPSGPVTIAASGLNSTIGADLRPLNAAPTGGNADALTLIQNPDTGVFSKIRLADVQYESQPRDDKLSSISNLDTTNGILEQTGPETIGKRALGTATAASIPTRGDADSRYQPIDATLSSLSGRDVGVAGPSSILTRGDGDARYQGLDATLTSLAALNTSTGLLEQTGTDAFTKRALGVGASTSIPTRADADARYQPLDGDLTAIAALSGTNSIYYRSGTSAWSPVTIGAGLGFSGGTLSAVGGVVTVSGSTEVEFNAAVAAAPVGGVIRVPYGGYTYSNQITINKRVTVQFEGGTISVPHNGATWLITTSGVQMVALGPLQVNGPRTTNALVGGSIGCYFAGTVGAPITDLALTGPFSFFNFRDGGVRIDHASRFIVQGILVRLCTYFGIMTVSSTDGHIDRNIVGELKPEGIGALGAAGFENAYGIAITRSSGSLASSPISARIWITRNRVFDVQTWSGIDTHGGQDIYIAGNHVVGCCRGVYITSGTLDSGFVPPINILVENNILSGTVYSLNRSGWGILAAGQPNYLAVGIFIRGNSIVGFGYNGSTGDTAAGVGVTAVVDFVIEGNNITSCKHHGMVLSGATAAEQTFGVVAANTVRGIAAVVGGVSNGILASGAYLQVTIMSGFFMDVTCAMTCPNTPASGNYGTKVARAIGLSNVSAMFNSAAGRIDLGATAL